MHSWRILILPYIDQLPLFQAYDFKERWDGPKNQALASRMPRVYALSGEERPGNTTTNYLAIVGSETVWQGGVAHESIKDGAGQTILMVENKGADVHWMEPRDLVFAQMDFTLNNPQGISTRYVDPAVVMVDGTIYRLTKNVEPATLRAMFTIAGGEKVAWDQEHGWHLLPDGRQRPAAEP
jgi:hypothetical protein